MRPADPLWDSARARECAGRRRPGGLIRMGRLRLGWRQDELGRRIGCSASTVSRLETRPVGDLRLVQRAARAVGVPDQLLGAALGLIAFGGTTVTAIAYGPQYEEDPMRRRSVVTAVALAAPASVLAGVDDVFAAVPSATVSHQAVRGRLVRARGLFDAGRYTAVLAEVPGILADAHRAAESRTEPGYGQLSGCYSLAAQALAKVQSYDRARIAADRATVYADLSGSALAAATAAREMAIVLRHQGRQQIAHRLVADAAARIEATGLTTVAYRSAYAQILCTTAYTAAQGGDRDAALTMIGEATAAARTLPAAAPVTSAAVDLYAVGVHRALGDSGAALELGSKLRAGQFPTAERRARFHTDMARAWWQWGKAAQTATALMDALRVSPSEVRDRPALRRIVTDLRDHHPLVPGVRDLAALTG
ncbi:helix-turn-helix domain-containing protein [Streptomyces sp. NPDC093221]|uniref:helix-turn-helix domain-containing protein n=1 Tax=Streptomyces sp. NPDC093221 TaxID=3366032 RepID=UPI00381EC130